jgi:hypothetical protein
VIYEIIIDYHKCPRHNHGAPCRAAQGVPEEELQVEVEARSTGSAVPARRARKPTRQSRRAKDAD